MLTTHPRVALCLLLAAAACTPATDGIDPKGKTFDTVAPEEAVTFTGTEPFWTLAIAAGEGVWTTPDNQPRHAVCGQALCREQRPWLFRRAGW